jgi:hypothetical protein
MLSKRELGTEHDHDQENANRAALRLISDYQSVATAAQVIVAASIF